MALHVDICISGKSRVWFTHSNTKGKKTGKWYIFNKWRNICPVYLLHYGRKSWESPAPSYKTRAESTWGRRMRTVLTLRFNLKKHIASEATSTKHKVLKLQIIYTCSLSLNKNEWKETRNVHYNNLLYEE